MLNGVRVESDDPDWSSPFVVGFMDVFVKSGMVEESTKCKLLVIKLFIDNFP